MLLMPTGNPNSHAKYDSGHGRRGIYRFQLHSAANTGRVDLLLVNLDKLTYAGNLQNLESVAALPRYAFVQGDIGERDLVRRAFEKRTSRAPLSTSLRKAMSIDPFAVQKTSSGRNVVFFALLEEVRNFWSGAAGGQKKSVPVSARIDR